MGFESTESSSNRDIIYAIRKIAGLDGLKKASFMTGTVTSVNEDDRTCAVEIKLGDAAEKLTGVNLSSNPNDGFILFPAADSDILICLMPDNTSYMISCEDIDKVICVIDGQNKYEFDANGWIWNDGNNGGLVKVIELTQKLNNLENWINQFILIFNGLTLPVSGSTAGPPSVPIANILTPTTKAEIENTKIKH